MAPRLPKNDDSSLVTVTCRLIEGDVEEIKRRAAIDGALPVPWQTKLRELVHESLKRKKVVR